MPQLKENKKRINLTDLEQIPEKRNRVFEISYVPRGDIKRLHKRFQRKYNLRHYLENPEVTKIKIYKCDVVNSNESEPIK